MEAKIIPFKKEHLECMEVREHERQIIANPDRLLMLEQTCIACTGMTDGRVVCCGGVHPFDNGSAEIWLIPSIYVNQYVMKFARELKKWLFGVRENLALHRMQTACIDDELHNNWMTFLGFRKVGYLEKYYNGVTYNMWERIWA